MTRTASSLRLALLQLASVTGDFATNAQRIRDAVAGMDFDLALTPELSLTGYDVGDAVHRLARPIQRGSPLPGFDPEHDAACVVGMIEADRRGPFNTAAVVRAGRVAFHHRKLHLPTYGMFDEARWFGRGSSLDTWSPAPGWTAGVLICEDFWHPALAYVLASRGIDLLLVQAAAPARGVWDGGEHGPFASADAWERIARTTAQLYGIYVALANRTGIEGAVTFAGGSLVAGPDGSLLARAGTTEQTLRVELSRDALHRSRQPYEHLRDDDPDLVLRELQRARAGSRAG